MAADDELRTYTDRVALQLAKRLAHTDDAGEPIASMADQIRGLAELQKYLVASKKLIAEEAEPIEGSAWRGLEGLLQRKEPTDDAKAKRTPNRQRAASN